ncbi:hypothetical protein AVEN_244585-1 [Araneus ventricosus]|uniref:Uncharacterized protein n=1 Tax=Araneus ventricosus TaxID=182803 RepID=A0A4Y2T626_ARAVE|nr:hypothetical protein AVEN_244585-1 [Araneus ventricosus]
MTKLDHIKTAIHDRSIPLKCRGGTPQHSLFRSSIYLGHLRSLHADYKSSAMGQSDPLLQLLLPLPTKREPMPFPISSRAREPPPSLMYLHRSHFNTNDPVV